MTELVLSNDKNQFPFLKIQEIQEYFTNSDLFDTKNRLCSIELNRAFQGFKFRYMSLQSQERKYYDITSKYGDTPPIEPINYRFFQDEAIYIFFICSVSLFDCYAYTLYAACSHLDPENIKLNSLDDGRYVYFSNFTENKFICKLLENTALCGKVEETKNDSKYKEIKIFRNYLNHRAHIPRSVYFSTNSNKNTRINTVDGLDVEINENTLQEYKEWIDICIEDLLNEFSSFLTDNF